MILHISKHLRTLLSSERCFHHTFRSFWQSFRRTRSSSYQYLPAGSGQPRTPRQEFKWYFKITENCQPAKSLQELSFAKFIADNPMVVISASLLALFFLSHSSILSHSHFVLVGSLEFYHLPPTAKTLLCTQSEICTEFTSYHPWLPRPPTLWWYMLHCVLCFCLSSNPSTFIKYCNSTPTSAEMQYPTNWRNPSK